MARVTKAQYEETVERATAAEEEADRLRQDLNRVENQLADTVTRSITRNSDYEEEIRYLRGLIDKFSSEDSETIALLEAQVESLGQQRLFLTNGLVTITAYGGDNIEVVQSLAQNLVCDFLVEVAPVEEIDE